MSRDRSLAIELRKKGKSYSEISHFLNVPKSTLSYWLKNIRLSQKLLDRLTKKSRAAGLKALIKRNKNQTMLAIERAERMEGKSFKEINCISNQDLKLIGAALYLGEGGKSKNRVDFTNSNPDCIKIIMAFFRNVCKVPNEKFRVQLSIHDEGKINIAKDYWSKLTGISINQFIKTSISVSKYSKKRRGNKLPFGTVQVRICDVNLFHTIMGWIKSVAQNIENVPG